MRYIGISERIGHAFGNHYTKYGARITPLYWRFQDDDLVAVRCAVCGQSITKDAGNEVTTLTEEIIRALKLPEFVQWLSGKLSK